MSIGSIKLFSEVMAAVKSGRPLSKMGSEEFMRYYQLAQNDSGKGDPKDDFGQRMRVEFDLRGGQLSDDERFALDVYLCTDLKRCMKRAEARIGQYSHSKNDPEGNWTNLMKAYNLEKRATDDLLLLKEIRPELGVISPELSGQEAIEQLGRIKENIWYAMEFSRRYEDVPYFQRKIDMAVKAEDYKTAASYRDKLNALVEKSARLD